MLPFKSSIGKKKKKLSAKLLLSFRTNNFIFIFRVKQQNLFCSFGGDSLEKQLKLISSLSRPQSEQYSSRASSQQIIRVLKMSFPPTINHFPHAL